MPLKKVKTNNSNQHAEQNHNDETTLKQANSKMEQVDAANANANDSKFDQILKELREF